MARELFSLPGPKKVLISQDYYRFIFNPSGGGSKANATVIHQMIEHNCLVSLKSGYDVILEGILSVKSYEAVLDRIIANHQGMSFMFYFDISFEETARRHQTREEKLKFSANEMREWYGSAHRSHQENLIPEHYTVQESVSHICKLTGLADASVGAIQQGGSFEPQTRPTGL